MAKHRRIIRKTQPARIQRVDDQLWPLVVAMVVLGGFLSGSVLAYLRLDDSRWYANAWTWLIAIPVVIATGLIWLAWTGNRLLRRTMQLAVVSGVTIHVILFILAIETDVFHRVWVEVLASAANPPQHATVKTPDYRAWQHDPQRRARRDTEQPVQISVPDPVVEPERPEQTQPQPTQMELQPRPVPEPQETPRPNVVKRPEPNQSVPRQRDEMSKLSRKEATVPDRPTQMVQLPDAVPRRERREDSPRPEETGLRPQPKTSEPLREPARPTPQALESVPTPQLARRQDSVTPTVEPPTAPAMVRSENRALVTPRADADAVGQPAIAKQNQPDAPLPHNTTASKQQTRAPNPRDRVEAPQREIAAESTANAARRDVQQPAPPRDNLAQTPRSVPNRQPRVTTRPDLTSVVDRVPEVAPTPSATPATEPSATALCAPLREDRPAVSASAPGERETRYARHRQHLAEPCEPCAVGRHAER